VTRGPAWRHPCDVRQIHPCLTLTDPVSQRLDDVCSSLEVTVSTPADDDHPALLLTGVSGPVPVGPGPKRAHSNGAGTRVPTRRGRGCQVQPACRAVGPALLLSPPTWSGCCQWPLQRSHLGCCWCWCRSAGGVPDVGSSISGCPDDRNRSASSSAGASLSLYPLTPTQCCDQQYKGDDLAGCDGHNQHGK
jgi:hypothetical protein